MKIHLGLVLLCFLSGCSKTENVIQAMQLSLSNDFEQNNEITLSCPAPSDCKVCLQVSSSSIPLVVKSQGKSVDVFVNVTSSFGEINGASIIGINGEQLEIKKAVCFSPSCKMAVVCN